MEKKLDLKNHRSICRECALINELKWPFDEYVCTWWMEICDVCQCFQSVCAVTDYKHPKQIWEFID